MYRWYVIIVTAYLRDDGVELIRDPTSSKWFLRMGCSNDGVWYWNARLASWVPPFKHPARDYWLEDEDALKLLETIRKPESK